MNFFKKGFIVCVLATALAQAETDITIQSKTYSAGATVNEWAQYTIQTGGTVSVNSGANVAFSAGNSITLYPGFQVQSGSIFQASVSYNASYNPGGYYNTITPTLALIAGDQQYGQVGKFNLQPFDIAIWNTSGTAPLVNAPVLITVNIGGGWLSATNGTNAVLTKSLQLTTDADGTVHGYYQQGTTELVTSSIQVVAGSQSWQFTTYSYSTTGANADTDGDGISNATEALLGTNSTQPVQVSTVPNLVVFNP